MITVSDTNDLFTSISVYLMTLAHPLWIIIPKTERRKFRQMRVVYLIPFFNKLF